MEHIQEEIRHFRERVKALSSQFQAALRTGTVPAGLTEETGRLKAEEERLLEAILPCWRDRVLQQRDPEAVLTGLVKNIDTIEESNLTQEERQLCDTLMQLDPPEEPVVPEEDSPDTGVRTQNAGDDHQQTGQDTAQANEGDSYGGTPYLCVQNAATAFVFLDDGSVLLYEHNLGWHSRKTPLVTDCFAQNAIMESDHSCLILNMDHGIDRLSYHRLETPEDLYQLPLYEDRGTVPLS